MARTSRIARAAAAPIATNQEALDTLITTRDSLDKGFDGAMNVDDMRRIARTNQAIIDEILRLNALGIQQLGERYKSALVDLQGIIEDLKQIQKDIKQITANIKTAAEVVSAIMKVLPILGVI